MTMNHQSTVTVKQSASPKEVQQTFSAALSPVHDIFKEKSKGKHLLVTDHPSLYLQTESISSPSFQLVSPLQRQKSGSSSVSDSSMSYISHLQYPKNMFSRSSTFCTSLYSSSTSTEAHQQFGNLPFLPHPPKCKQTVPANPSPKSSLLLSGDLNNQFSEESGYLMKDFLNSPEVELECSFHGGTHGSNSLTLTEQMELQFLSEQLDIAITDNGANPGIDEIYEAPQVSSPPTAVTNDNHNYPPSLESPVDNQIHSCHPSSGNAASHKPRMRWTPELHECFLEAVKKLDGAEKATPKGILKLMNIEGLTIYHVKSHLQKYRLAKYMPETTKDKKSISSEENEKKADPNIINESDAHSKRGIQVAEALRMQMDVQRQLHEQLEVQRALQLRIEEHARYLHKILEEQEKASNTFASSSNNTSILNNIGLDTEHSALPTPVHSMPEQTDSKTDSSASLPSKHLGNECHEVEQLVGQKRTRHEVKPEPGALRMESPVHH